MTVTRGKFKAYQKVQSSGLTDMSDIKKVQEISDFLCNVPLTKEDCLEIVTNYKKLEFDEWEYKDV